MAIQAQLYSDNTGFPVGGGDGGGGGGNDGSTFNQFCPSLQQQHQQVQQQQLQNQQPWNQGLLVDQHVIDQFIISQNDSLRLLLQEQSKQQIPVLLKTVESRASILFNKKEEDILKARNKTIELQNLLKKLEMDNHIWKKAAHENEAMILFLNSKLEILKEQALNNNNGGRVVDDAESCYEVKNKREDEGLICKCCNRGGHSCVVLFLPCRHLCSCKDCEPLLDSCLVCATPKKGSIEVLIS